MTAFALKRRLGLGAAGIGHWAAAALALAWTGYSLNLITGVTYLPGVGGYGYLAVLLGGPAAAITVAVLQRERAHPLYLWLAAWTGLVAFAVLAALYSPSSPQLVLAIPALAISALFSLRWPVATLAGVFFITGAFNTLEAYVPFPTRALVDLGLGGLWAGVVWSYFFSSRERPLWVWPGILLGMLYLAFTTAWIMKAESMYIGVRAFRESGWYMAAFLLVAFAPWDEDIHKRMARAFVAVAALVGAYATFRWLVGPAQRELILATAANRTQEFVEGELRLFGSLNSGKALSAWTAAMIPFCLAMALTMKGRWRLVAAVASGLCTLGLLGSEARAGFVAAVVGVAVVLALYQFARAVPGLHIGVTGLAVVSILGVGVFLFTQTAGDDRESSDRYTRLVNFTEDPSYQARIFKWETALDTIEEHPLGQGLGTSGGIQQRYGRFVNISTSSIDSSYLKIAFEQGLIVMGMFVFALVALLAGLARRSILTLDRHKAGIGIGAAGALIGFIVIMYSGTYVDGLTALTGWLVIGLGVAQFTSNRGADASA